MDGNPRAGISTALPAHFQTPHGSPQRGAGSMPPNMGSQKKYTMKQRNTQVVVFLKETHNQTENYTMKERNTQRL